MLGPNGGGKTTVFDSLECIRAFVTGEGRVGDLFPNSTLTLWQNVLTQSFEFEWEREGFIYRYELGIEPDQKRAKQRVSHERLWFENQPLLRFEDGEVHLYRDNYSEGPIYPFDWTQSALASLTPRPDNTKLTWFKTAMHRSVVLQIIPPFMEETSLKESQRPSRHFENFVSWYRWLSQDQGIALRLQQTMQDVLTEFESFKFDDYGPEVKLLKTIVKAKGKRPFGLNFSSLSDGQRMLIALYALVQGLNTNLDTFEGDDSTPAGLLCLDEPDNFVSIREIQPWLTDAEDRLMESKARILMISHNPEIINYALTPSSGESPSVFWFDREEGGHTRVSPVDQNAKGALKPSELVARGWLKS